MKTWNRVLLEMLISLELKKLHKFYGTGKFIAIFTRAKLFCLSWAKWLQCMPYNSVSLSSILILSFPLCLGLLSGPSPSLSHQNPIVFLFFMCATCLSYHVFPSSLFWSPYSIWCGVHIHEAPQYVVLISPYIISNILLSNMLIPCSCLHVIDKVSCR